MSGPGDLVTHLEADTTDWSSGMTEASKATEQVTLVVHEQRASWTALAHAAIPAIGQVTSAVAGLIGTLATIRHHKEMIAGIGSAFSSAGNAAWKFIGPISRIAGAVVPQLRAVSAAVSVSAFTYKALTRDIEESADVQVDEFGRATTAVGRLQQSFDELGDAVARPFQGAAEAAKRAVSESATLAATFGYVKGVAGGFVDFFAGALSGVASEINEATDSVAALSQVANGNIEFGQADQWLAEGDALKQLAKDTEAAIAVQERRLEVSRQLSDIQRGAAEAAANAAQVEQIHNITTLEGIEAQRAALQKLAHDAIVAGANSEAFLKQQAALFSALEAQRSAIESGKVGTEGQKEAEKALQSLNEEIAKLSGAYDQLTEAKRRAAGVSEEVLNEIKARQDQKRAIEESQAAQKQAQKELEEDTRRQVQAWQQETDKIQSLKDELDVLTGAASRADIERRKALEAGFTQAGADEIASLTQQLEEARKKDEQKSGIRGDFKTLGAAVQGSREAYSAIAKNMSMGRDAKLEKLAEKQLEETKKQTQALEKASGVGGGNVVIFGGDIPQ